MHIKSFFAGRLCFFLLATVLFTGRINGQGVNNDLNAFALRANAGSEISFVFSATDNKGKEVYNDSGKSIIYGNKYTMEIPGDLLVVNNGLVRWIYKINDEEIVIADNNPEEEDVLENPFAVLRTGRRGKLKNYTVSVVGRGSGAPGELKDIPDKIILTATGGAKYTIKITGFKSLPDINEKAALFELDTSRYPRAIITDLREQ